MNATVCTFQSPSSYPWFNALGARPALRFALQPDKLPPAQTLVRQGSVILSRQDMEVLFGSPCTGDSQDGSLVWSLNFLDRTGGESLAIMVSNADDKAVDGYTARTWAINGMDNRALQAVREYVRFHFGSDAV